MNTVKTQLQDTFEAAYRDFIEWLQARDIFVTRRMTIVIWLEQNYSHIASDHLSEIADRIYDAIM